MTYSASLVTEYVQPQLQVVEYIQPAPQVTYAAPTAPVNHGTSDLRRLSCR